MARVDPAVRAALVLPAGQEALVADLVGRGADLPGGCRLESAAIRQVEILARYRCGEREVGARISLAGPASPSATADGRLSLQPDPAMPPALVEALAARLLDGAGRLRWVPETSAVPAPSGAEGRRDSEWESAASALPWLAGAGLALALVAALAWRPWRWRGSAAAVALPVARSRSAAATCGAALLLAAGSHALLRGFGLALAAVVAREPGWARALALVVALAGLGAALSGVALLRGAGVRRGAGLSAAVAAAYLVTAFLVARPAPVPPGLGGLLLPQRGPWEEGYPGRPQVTYRVSGQGFRGPVFDLAPQPGVRRIVLIGDSFVFGSGVPEEGTLSSSLARALARRPGQPAEVLNLGVIGSNLASHVDLLEAVVRHLSPDAVVLCLTLPNDLSRWDVQVARREALRPGLFALARLLLGDEGAQVAWDLALLERQTTPEGLAHLRRQLERVARLRQEAGARVTFFVYGAGGPGLGEAVGAIPGADLVAPAHRVADFIPGDGHPTAEGNDAFAALLAERLQRP